MSLPDAFLTVWVLYYDPSDFPGEWVVRRQRIVGSEIKKDPDLSARAPTRAACEAALVAFHPVVRSLHWLERSVGDDPCIVGTWI